MLCDPPRSAPPSPTPTPALDDVIAPLLTSGALLYAVLWALAALLLPWLVRGRWLAADLVAASIWAAALGASNGRDRRVDRRSRATRARRSEPSLAGVIAVARPHLRGVRVVEP